jgi:hypothetical protein
MAASDGRHLVVALFQITGEEQSHASVDPMKFGMELLKAKCLSRKKQVLSPLKGAFKNQIVADFLVVYPSWSLTITCPW